MAPTFLHLDASAYIFPRGGRWTREHVQELVEACQRVPSLVGVSVGHWERGLEFPGTEEVRLWSLRQPWKSSVYHGDLRTNYYHYYFGSKYVNCVQFLPKYGTTLQQLVDVVRVAQDKGHTLLATRGFDVETGRKGRGRYLLKTLAEAKARGMPVRHGTKYSRGRLQYVWEESFHQQT